MYSKYLEDSDFAERGESILLMNDDTESIYNYIRILKLDLHLIVYCMYCKRGKNKLLH